MRNKIEKPKIFISYAWGNIEYQRRVLAFATDLINDGFDVILDKWDLSEGHDTYAFMEKCATDKSITNVLMLLDPVYAEKADGRLGGVGTETQIISSEVYGKVEQDKFIPVVFARDEDDNVCKPTYLKALLHFDLSKEESYDSEYQRLVKRLYGIEIYAKPQLGNRPEWVDTPKVTASKTIAKYEKLKQNDLPVVKNELFSSNLNTIKELFLRYGEDNASNSLEYGEYINLYDGMQEIRNDFLALLPYYIYVADGVVLIGDFFEEMQNIAKAYNDLTSEVKQVFVHELFVYVIAYLVKKKDYKSVGYLLGKTYFDNRNNEAVNYSFFYSASNHTNLDNSICKRDDKKYFSGTAAHWIETLAETICSKSDLVLADLLCYNYSLLGSNYRYYWKWFPILYAYGGNYNYTAAIQPIAIHMQSREFLSKFILLFGYDTIDEFVKKYKEIENDKELREYRYPSSFDPAPALVYLIKSDKLGILP